MYPQLLLPLRSSPESEVRTPQTCRPAAANATAAAGKASFTAAVAAEKAFSATAAAATGDSFAAVAGAVERNSFAVAAAPVASCAVANASDRVTRGPPCCCCSSRSAAANPGNTSTPSASAYSASHRQRAERDTIKLLPLCRAFGSSLDATGRDKRELSNISKRLSVTGVSGGRGPSPSGKGSKSPRGPKGGGPTGAPEDEAADENELSVS